MEMLNDHFLHVHADVIQQSLSAVGKDGVHDQTRPAESTQLYKYLTMDSQRGPLTCLVCGTVFQWQWTLAKHFEQQHRLVPNPYKKRPTSTATSSAASTSPPLSGTKRRPTPASRARSRCKPKVRVPREAFQGSGKLGPANQGWKALRVRPTSYGLVNVWPGNVHPGLGKGPKLAWGTNFTNPGKHSPPVPGVEPSGPKLGFPGRGGKFGERSNWGGPVTLSDFWTGETNTGPFRSSPEGAQKGRPKLTGGSSRGQGRGPGKRKRGPIPPGGGSFHKAEAWLVNPFQVVPGCN